MENLANLNCKAGGENEKLIFKILKRGEKLRLQEAHGEDDLVDGGLRYDLTVPLVRYYANHANELPAPFKALQVMSGGRTGLSAAAIVSLCSAISTFWGKRVIWRRSS